MIISELNYLETVAGGDNITGATGYKPAPPPPRFAFADAIAKASASGVYFASTLTVTHTSASTRGGHATASSGSLSSSVAS